MDSAYYEEIKGKIVKGVFALSSRTLIIQVITQIANFILTVILSASAYGVFYTVSAVLSFISTFSDVGLAGSLIQKKEKITNDELVSAFTIQIILVGFLVVIGCCLSPIIANLYHIGNEGVFLLRALFISFFISSLKSIPSIILERNLEFSKLVIPQLVEVLVFYSTTIILVYFGHTLYGYAFGAIARSIVGLISIFIISPWKIGIGINFKIIRKLLHFGMPFQTNSILALIKDDLVTLFLGLILTQAQMGYIGWAKKYAESALRLIMDNIIRVTFPAYSRLQGDSKIFSRALNKSFFFLALFIFPSSVLLVIIMNPMIHLIPKYIKWEPALFTFYLFVFSSIMAALSSPTINALNAIGKIRISLKMMIVWTILTWIFVPTLTLYFGFNGVAISSVVISFTSIIPIILLKKIVDISVIKSISKPLISSIVMGIVALFITLFGSSIMIIIISVIIPIIIYGVLIKLTMATELGPYIPIKLRRLLRFY
jgi:O-antigen/teichoic acid export membrane protein